MLPVEVQRWRFARNLTRRTMCRNKEFSRWIAFVVYSFIQLADSAAIVRRAPPMQSSYSLNSPVDGSAQTAQAATPSTTWSEANEITIIAIVIGGVFLLGFVLVIWIIMRRSRKALERQTQTVKPAGPEFCKDVSAAFDVKAVPVDNSLESGVNRSSWASYVVSIQPRDNTLSPSNTMSTRQLYISNQVRRAREKVAELEEKSIPARSSSTSSRQDSIKSPSSWTGSEVTAAPSPSEELPTISSDFNSSNPADEKLEHAIRQIEALNGRICELELQRGSSWQSDDRPLGSINSNIPI
ncbi:hypothetical protein C8F04DRAFT_524215 [Mycena alexandri]|uniref:Uncharacterized protein n=1 Tax=Mycena alexandri TaxID=1745969 RepID=A0AAD6THJ4_9AGAR|nr:hypothetical protein C8F04DRAFT_524215 [Mycena alexandri]